MLMDKVEDKSHAIQPVFGYNNFGPNGGLEANFEQLLQQLLEHQANQMFNMDIPVNEQPPLPDPPSPSAVEVISLSSSPPGTPYPEPDLTQMITFTSSSPPPPISEVEVISLSPSPPGTPEPVPAVTTTLTPASPLSMEVSVPQNSASSIPHVPAVTSPPNSSSSSSSSSNVFSQMNPPMLLPPGALLLPFHEFFPDDLQSYFIFSPETFTWEPGQNPFVNQNGQNPAGNQNIEEIVLE